MKKNRLLTSAVLALAGVGLMASPARAAILTYSDDDLILGFHATGGTGVTLDYMVNLGQASIYRDATGTFKLDGSNGSPINLGNIGADLAATFGSDWSTRDDLYWGIFGSSNSSDIGSDIAGTEYASKAETTYGTARAAFNRANLGIQTQTGGKISAAGIAYAQNYTSTANSPKGAIQNTTDPDSYASYQTNSGTTSFTNILGALGTFSNGANQSALDLFRMTPSGVANQKGSYEGTFTIDGTSGVITFSTTPPSAVPEPSTYGLAMAAAAVAFIVARRRRSQANA